MGADNFTKADDDGWWDDDDDYWTFNDGNFLGVTHLVFIFIKLYLSKFQFLLLP